MLEFNPLDRCIGGLHGFESAHGIYQLFEFSVISLDNIVQILYLPVYRILRAFPFFLQLIYGGTESRRFICINRLRMCPWFYGFERFA